MDFRKRLDELHLALSFFTRFPVPHFNKTGFQLKVTYWAWPIIGALIGFCSAIAYTSVTYMGLSQASASIVALMTSIIITGALHEDGLADCADSFGGYTQEKRLEIMKDSRIGAFGTLALIIIIFLKWSAINDLDKSIICTALILAPMVSRTAVFANLLLFSVKEGKGLRQEIAGSEKVLLSIFTIIWFFTIVVLSSLNIIAVLCALLTAALFGFFMQKRIGGQTGDVLGASIVLSEIVYLLLL